MRSIEDILFRSINSLAGQSGVVDLFMVLLSDSRTWLLTGAVVFVIGLRLRDAKIMAALFGGLLALGASDLISFEVIKPIVARERPCWLLPDVVMVMGRCGGSYGFTSNHAANAFAVWWMVVKTYGLRHFVSQGVLTIATLVAISRVYLGVHFVGDVVGGAILGVAVAASMSALGLSALTGRFIKRFFPTA